MNIQIVRDQKGRPEYALVPVKVYRALQRQIDEEIAGLEAEADKDDDYERFDPADFVGNPVAVIRMRAGIRQKHLARAMGVSAAYVSKLENSQSVTPRALERVRTALERLASR